jgi:hypothetical protein
LRCNHITPFLSLSLPLTPHSLIIIIQIWAIIEKTPTLNPGDERSLQIGSVLSEAETFIALVRPMAKLTSSLPTSSSDECAADDANDGADDADDETGNGGSDRDGEAEAAGCSSIQSDDEVDDDDTGGEGVNGEGEEEEEDADEAFLKQWAETLSTAIFREFKEALSIICDDNSIP